MCIDFLAVSLSACQCVENGMDIFTNKDLMLRKKKTREDKILEGSSLSSNMLFTSLAAFVRVCSL